MPVDLGSSFLGFLRSPFGAVEVSLFAASQLVDVSGLFCGFDALLEPILVEGVAEGCFALAVLGFPNFLG